MRTRALLIVCVTACGTPASPAPKPPAVASAPAASSAAPQVPAPPGKARIALAPRKSTYFLGENVLIDFCVVSTSAAPITISVGGDYRGSSRSLRFKVEARDGAGHVMPDPDPHPVNFGGMGYSPKIEPGGRWCASLPLMHYARIDAPGTYAITATHDLGWKDEKAPTGATQVTLAMPSAAEAEGVIAAMEALPDDPNGSAGKVLSEYADFSALRYDVYTAPLARRAAAGDVRAIEGLANIPSEAATRALVALLGNASPEVARSAARSLAMRLPDPALSGGLGARNPFESTYADQRHYLGRAWVPALADDVRAAAHKRLASSAAEDVIDGAFMLEALGTPADGPDLVKALDAAIDRTRTVPAETNVYPTPRGACQELLRAADMLVDRKLATPAHPKSPGEIALWLVGISRGARPAGWEAELGRAMRHPIAYVRQLALERAPHGALPASLLSTVGADLADRDLDVIIAAAQLAEREHFASLAPAIVRAMPKATDIRLNALSAAAYALGARYDRAQMLASMLPNAAAFQQAFGELVGALDHHGYSSNGSPTDVERKALAARWAKFVAQHRADVQAGNAVPLSDPSVTPDLLPREWKLDRADGTTWP